MDKKTTLSIRLDGAQTVQIEALASKFRVKEVDIIRWGIDSLIEYVARHGGHLHLPIDFDAMWTQVRATAPRRAAISLNEPGSTYPAGGEKKA